MSYAHYSAGLAIPAAGRQDWLPMLSLIAKSLVVCLVMVNMAWAVDLAADAPLAGHGAPVACSTAGDGTEAPAGTEVCCHFCHASGHLSGMVPQSSYHNVARGFEPPGTRAEPAIRSRTWAPPTPPPNV